MTKNLRLRIASSQAVLTLLLFAGLVPAAAAADYNVSTLRYENKGGYTAGVAVRYGKCSIGRWVVVGKGSTVDYKLGANNPEWEDKDCKNGPQLGDEVWMTIEIEFGDKQSCRKDSTKFYYNGTDGGTVKYVTKGTTLNNNRCQIASKPSDDHIIQ